MNGQQNRNGKNPAYRDPRAPQPVNGSPRRNPDPYGNSGGRNQPGYPRSHASRRRPANNQRPSGAYQPSGNNPHRVQPDRTRTAPVPLPGANGDLPRRTGSTGHTGRVGESLRYPAARFGVKADVPLLRRGWFRIWMMVLVLIAIVAIVAVAVSSSGGKADENSDMSLTAMTRAPQPPATDAPDENDGLFRAYVDDGTADMSDDIDSGYGVLIDVGEGKILSSKGAYEKINPASMTKLMTLIVAYENIDDLTGYFEMTSAIIDPVYTSDASLAGFSPGETVLIKDLFYGAALPSGADATSALAICAAGDEDSFAVMMNAKAKELGLKDTHFENASGLHGNNHYSTCYDMAIILKCAMDNEFLRGVISTYQYTTASTEKHPEGLKLENTMLSRMHGDEAPGFTIIGGKTGYTPNAGHCLASFGKRNSDGAQFILVTAKGADRYAPVFDAIEVYGKYAVPQTSRDAVTGNNNP